MGGGDQWTVLFLPFYKYVNISMTLIEKKKKGQPFKVAIISIIDDNYRFFWENSHLQYVSGLLTLEMTRLSIFR